MNTNPDSILRDLQARLEQTFLGSRLDQLNYKLPALLKKNGRVTARLQIYGKAAGHIWSAGWCFYEFELPIPPTENHGSVGFISFPENKQCGGGKHREHIRSTLAAFASTQPNFAFTPPGVAFLGLYTRYDKGFHSTFPQNQAFEDMRTLIEGTFDKLNLLGV